MQKAECHQSPAAAARKRLPMHHVSGNHGLRFLAPEAPDSVGP
jgi:hypothetical protein